MTGRTQCYPGIVDPLREALEEIVGLTSFLRQGGPDPMDLQGLSNALDHATSLAHAALAVPDDVRPLAQRQIEPTEAQVIEGAKALRRERGLFGEPTQSSITAARACLTAALSSTNCGGGK